MRIHILRTLAASVLALFGLLAVWGEFTAIAAIADTRWAGFLMAGTGALLFVWQYRRADRALGRAIAFGGAAISLAVFLFAVKLLFFTYRELQVSFENGGVRLAGTLYLPKRGGTFPAVVFLHGSGAETRSEARYHAKLFARNRFAALTYDKRGAGESTGDTWVGTYDDYARDAVAGIRFLQSRQDISANRIGVRGQSEGAWVATLVAGSHVPSLSFLIVTSATHLTPAEQVIYESGAQVRQAGFSEDVAERARTLQARVMNYHRSGDGHDALLADLQSVSGEAWFEAADLPSRLYPLEEYGWWRAVMDFNPVAEWEKVRCPVLAISGGLDPKSDAEQSQEGIRRALAAGGNTNFTGRIFPNMEHGNIEWWLPGRIPPPRFPRGYSDLLVTWAWEQVRGQPSARSP